MTLRSGLVVILCLGLSLLGCDDNGGTDAGGGTDSGMMGSDSGTDAGGGGTDAGTDAGDGTDAGGMDAGDTDAGDTDAGDIDAGPPGAGACGATDLVIEAVDPGVGVTLYNPTSSPIDASNYVLCQRPMYPTVMMLEMAAVTIAPGAREVIDWRPSFADTDAGGEIALYVPGGSFASPAAQVDYVCWGDHTGGRMGVGNWTGPCAGAITGGSLNRVQAADGFDAASWDPTGTAPAISCP